MPVPEPSQRPVRDIASSLQSGLRMLMLWTAILSVGLVANSLWTRHVSNENKDALCAYRTDLQSRLRDGVAYLALNPRGGNGITPAGVANQQRAADSLAGLSCG